MTQELQTQSLKETREKALDAQFLMEYAVGWEDDTVLIKRFNIDPANWKTVKKDKLYQAEVSRVRAELEKDGRMSRYKARLYAHELLDVVYGEALSPDTTLDRKIEALKVLSNLADMGTKQKDAVVASGVQITLNLAPQPKPISVEVSQPNSSSEGDNTVITPQSLEDKSDV